jgi:TRAP-type C4-dicarboxylate transport system substrate-binding protein
MQMPASRRRFLALAGGAIAAPGLLREGHAQAPKVTLKLHHFLGPQSNGHAKLLAPWAKQVEADSGGRIKIDVYPSMQLGGAPPQLYDQARDGVVDLVWHLLGSSAGRFPGIEVIELPFVAARRGVANARATQELYETHLRDEFGDVHPICVWAHDHGVIHANRPVRRLDDLRGLKLRSPTRQAGEGLRAVGASAIGMPVPNVPEALAQRAIDGAVIPWEVIPALRVHELVRNHTEIPGTPTFYTATFVLAMNKAKYESLPADLKGAIDKNSGQVAATMAGAMWDEQAVVVTDIVKKRGNTLLTLSEDDKARWRKLSEPVVEAWIRQVKERGIDGGKLLEAARALVAKYDRVA